MVEDRNTRHIQLRVGGEGTGVVWGGGGGGGGGGYTGTEYARIAQVQVMSTHSNSSSTSHVNSQQ